MAQYNDMYVKNYSGCVLYQQDILLKLKSSSPEPSSSMAINS